MFSDTTKLKIDGVFHKAVVEVDEKGTKAAASTGIVMVPVMASYHEEFTANHPFLFIIRDNKTNTFLFVGQISQFR